MSITQSWLQRREKQVWAFLMLALLALSSLGCPGGGGSGSGAQPVTIAIVPGNASLAPGGKTNFAAVVTGATDTAVSWSVQEGAAGGSITNGGDYTAPAAAGTYHVISTSLAQPSKTATVTIRVHLLISVSPTSATISLGQSQPFSVSITGSTDTGVSWSVEEGASGGSISVSGVYTAPNTPGTFHVVATSQADSTQSATAIVVVQAGSATGTIN